MNWFKFIFPRFVYTVSILTFYTFAICNTVDLYSYNYSKHLVRQLPGTCEWNDHPIYLLHACYVEQRHTHIVNKCLFFTFINWHLGQNDLEVTNFYPKIKYYTYRYHAEYQID